VQKGPKTAPFLLTAFPWWNQTTANLLERHPTRILLPGDAIMPFELPKLPYTYNALEPAMSKETLEYHHDRHHKTYVETANKLIAGTELEGKSLEEVIKAAYQDPALKTLFNNAAQHWNHSQFWHSMTPDARMTPSGELGNRIESDLGGLEKFRKDFVEQGVADFGSGWVWLVTDGEKLSILTTSNAENPLVLGKTTLLTCDVWEHAYYIDYRNEREKFLKAFVNELADWDYAAEIYEKASERRAAA
jgi:Fe-Mn family superoxide dismutase